MKAAAHLAPDSVHEAVGLFQHHDDLQSAIDKLEASGFARHEISVLGSEKAVRERYGTRHISTKALEDDPTAPRSAKPKPEEVGIAKGVLIGGGAYAGVAAALIATGGGAAMPALGTTVVIGGLGGVAVGGLLAKLLGDEYADFFKRQIESGGLLLWVNTPTVEKEQKAQSILKKYGAEDVHIHVFTPPTRLS